MKKLYRSREDKKLCGVCGGFGEYFQIDSTLIIVAFVFTVLFAGFGLLVYIILALVIPQAD